MVGSLAGTAVGPLLGGPSRRASGARRGSTPGQNPTSGSRTARRVHRLVAGDSLELLAHREYGDQTAWRVIAEAND
ncbi:LysM peptidoglycan-binding domain-containing protein, partial [Micromonospora sp. Rc5]|uniref:LysM peptidoglycan-binding domain-containing protein n=1 Tax=Micromonospora sp. Rc5 TaxID=1920666 RepID=UPI0034CE5D02